MKKIKPPFLSTSFSESGKSAKRRFANILAIKRRKAGAAIVALALAGVLCAGALVACEVDNGPAAPESNLTSAGLYDDYVQELYALRQTVLDEESANSIAKALGIADTFGNYTLSVEDNDLKFVFETPFSEMGQYDCFKKASIYSDVIGALIDAQVDVKWGSPESMNISFSPDHGRAWEGEDAFKEYLTEIGFAKTKEPSLRVALESADVEEFKKNAVVVYYDRVENQAILQDFLQAVREHREAALDILQYTVEGDPILTRIQGNGRNFGGGIDSSRDKFLGGETFYDCGMYYDLRIFKDGDTAHFYLVNDPKLTLQEIVEYSLSSRIYENPPEFQQLFFIEEGEAYEEAIY